MKLTVQDKRVISDLLESIDGNIKGNKKANKYLNDLRKQLNCPRTPDTLPEKIREEREWMLLTNNGLHKIVGGFAEVEVICKYPHGWKVKYTVGTADEDGMDSEYWYVYILNDENYTTFDNDDDFFFSTVNTYSN